MRFSSILLALAAIAATVASGSVECTPAKQAWNEHRGAELYSRMCAVCHGMNGEGYKADQAPAIGHSDYLASASDEYLHHAITDGRYGTTMSAWGIEHGGPLKARDVEATLDERPATGDAAKGDAIYGQEC